MLIFTRRTDESVKIGQFGEITVTLLSIQGNQARLGFEAPKNIPVHRSEVYQEIQQREKPQ